jgi:serine protease Do
MQMLRQKKMVAAGIVLLALTSTGWAQDTTKDKKDHQTIVITRTGDSNEKTVIEIDGKNVVKINGKDAKDIKDVTVNINNIKGARIIRGGGPDGAWSFSMADDEFSLFNEDENRAMLGIVTEGNSKGASISSVTKESAAEKAGLKKGDVLTSIGSKKIETTDDVTEAIRSHKPGDKVNITYLRDGKEQKQTVELGKWKGIRMNAVTVPGYPAMPRLENFRAEGLGGNSITFSSRPKLGLSIQDTDDGKGVKVLEVEAESNAAKAGLRKDDVILSVDDKELKSTDDITRMMMVSRDKHSYMFKVNRGGKMQNIEVKMPRKLKTADL